MFEVKEIAKDLEWRSCEGVWVSRSSAAVSYPEGGNEECFAVEENSFWFRHRNSCIVETLRLFPPPGIVFDVGGGNGYVALAIQQAGFDAAVLEPNLSGALRARARGLSPVICSTLLGAGFERHSIPAIGIFDVLEHIEDDRAFLKTLSRLLRPDGKLYLTVPAYTFLWSAEDDYAGHFRRYTLTSVVRALCQSGFQVEFASYFFSWLPLPILFLRSVPTKLGFRHGSGYRKSQSAHVSLTGPIGRILNFALTAEIKALRRKVKIPFGGSCLVVARPN